MSDKEKGLYQKYRVKKVGKPREEMDCIVLEFNDPIARHGIRTWAHLMHVRGYHKCAGQVLAKLDRIEKTKLKGVDNG